MEITTVHLFPAVRRIDLDLVPAEITYGLERLVAFLQGVESVYDIAWTPEFKYSQVRYQDELQFSVYNFEKPMFPCCGVYLNCTRRNARASSPSTRR